MISPIRVTVMFATLILISVVAFVPFETVTVPEWKVRVVNREGVAQPFVEVRQSWKNYTLDLSDGPESREVVFADSKGEVTFPERRDSASLFYRMIAIPYGYIGAVVSHDSIGIQSTVYSSAGGSEFLSCNGCSDPPGILVIKGDQ